VTRASIPREQHMQCLSHRSSSPHYDLDAICDHGLENVFDGRVAKDFVRGTELGVDLPFSAGDRLGQILLPDGIGGPSGESAAALPFNIPGHLVRHFVVPSVKRNGPGCWHRDRLPASDGGALGDASNLA